MRIRFIWPGKTKDERLRSLIDEYLKRLSRFTRCEVVEVKESGALNKQSQRILEAISDANLAVLLDLTGKDWSSEELARQVQRWENDSVKEIAIVIGGPEGVGAAVRDCADVKWRMSRLTLTHEMVRVLVVEQFYRAYAINRGVPYQK